VNLSNGPAVLGTSQNGTGVQASSTHGFGIQAGTADGIGILERSTGTGRGIVGVLGAAASCPGTYAVGGCGTTVGDGVVGTSVDGNGLFGASTNGKGIYGNSNSRGIVGTLSNTSCAGTYAVGGCGTSTGIGVYGDSTTRGVVGTLNGGSCPGTFAIGGCTTSGKAIWGQATTGTGILGTATGTGAHGVDGESDNGPGVYGQSANSYAGDFIGDVLISGSLTVGGGCSGCAGAQLKVAGRPATMLNGNVRTNARGFATVRVPKTFQAAGPSVRYQLTVVGTRGWNARVVKLIRHGRFTIQTDRPGVRVSWQVTNMH
jgi:hypothetical protein